MQTFKTIDEIRQWRGARDSIGFTPTMGALHQGHASLIRGSLDDCESSVVSIFINPAQFAPDEDLGRYPRTLDADLEMCAELGVDAVFVPTKAMMYPDGFATWVSVDGLTDKLCGKSRPDHFRGVTTVVSKLFNIVNPDRAYFGQKDAQQAIVLKRMTRDLNLCVEIVTCPTVREPDGLALSSRNKHLNEHDRQRALVLNRALNKVKTEFENGVRNVNVLRSRLQVDIGEESDRLDYAEILDAETLNEINEIERPALVAVAGFFGATRLIDNVVLGGS